MRCASCEHDNPTGNRFCGGCGAALARRCPACEHPNPPDHHFCGECGAALTEPPASVSVAATERSRRAHTPKHLADKILQAKSTLEGERKQVTVLFADVKGSMELAEQLDPEEWSAIMQRFFGILAEGVERFEGFVDKFTGDGIMALFGAPIAHEDHAERACYAALHLRDAVREYADDVRAHHGVPFGVRIGLNSGEVVVGHIGKSGKSGEGRDVGGDLRMEYTAQGHTVGLAQRMETLAESGHICMSESTARRVEGYFEVRDLGRTNVKGVSEPVGLFELEGIGAFRTRLDRSRARGLSTFVGRDRDMSVLESALERAGGGSGQVVGVMAEAGTGKSRLCAEFLDDCRARGIPIFEGRGVAHGKSIPMLPMLELWRAFYGIADGDSPEATRAKIAGQLLLIDDAFREALPVLFDLFGVPDAANPAPAMDPERRQKSIQGVVKRLLHDPAYHGARVILLEDLHWFDGASDAFLETFVESVPVTGDLWLLNFRPEYQAGWMQRSYYQHLALQPLGADAIRALLADQLGNDSSVATLPEAIHARTKGNPFFIEEVVQSLVESGHLQGTRGAYRLVTPVEALEVPASVQAVLAARIDRLPERDRHLLQTAAVIGKTFSESILREVARSIAAVDEDTISASLSALVAAEFLFEAALYPQLEFSFKHPLTQEVAQQSQLRERRVRVHGAVAQALEDTGGNLEERAAEIAQHWNEANDANRAARWYRRAAEWAGLSDARESLRHWRSVRELVPRIEDANERSDIALAACNEILSLGWRMGGTEEEGEAVYAEGRALAEKLEDSSALALLVGRYSLMRFSVAGSGQDYARYGEEAALLAQSSEDPALLAAVTTFPAFGYWAAGYGRQALEWADRVLAAVGSDDLLGKDIVGYSPRVGMYHPRVNALIRQGRLAEARTLLIEGVRVAEATHEFEVLGWLLLVRGELAVASGANDVTLEHGRRSLEDAEQLDNESARTHAHAVLGFAYLADGDAAAAREAFAKSAAISRENRIARALSPWLLAMLSEADLALGEREDALATAREGITLASAGGCRYFEVYAQLALIRALLTTDDVVPREEIESALLRCDDLVEEIESVSQPPQILEQRGRLAAAVGDAPAADLALRQALDLYRAIGATGHVERLERELKRPSLHS